MKVFVTVEQVGKESRKVPWMEGMVLLDIDSIRRMSDPQRWEETDPWHIAARAQNERGNLDEDASSP